MSAQPARLRRRQGAIGPRAFMGFIALHQTRQPGKLCRIPLHWIIALPQVRKTFTDILALAEDIAINTLLEPLLVVRYTAEELQKYLAAINDRDGTTLAVRDFAAIKGQYYVLIAGECRLRALRILWEEGCEVCREKGKVRRGSCYRKHLGSNRVEVKMFQGISVAEALGKQMSENSHTRPPEHEEAVNISWMFRTYRVIDPSITPRRFARHIGRTPETVEKAIMFCQLPDAIRSAVARSGGQNPTTGRWQYIRYGHAIQIARLQLAGESEVNLLQWRDRVLHDMLSVPDMREQVNKALARILGGQTGLFAALDPKALAMAFARHRRATVLGNFIMLLHALIRYYMTVLAMFETGDLGLEESPFSSKSPRKLLRTLITLLEKTNKHQVRLLSAPESVRMQAATMAVRVSNHALEQLPIPSVQTGRRTSRARR